jgi:hypothetical protein
MKGEKNDRRRNKEVIPRNKQTKFQFEPKQTETRAVCFGSIETSKYRSETTETNVLYQIVPKIVSVPVSVCFESKLVLKDTLPQKHEH